MEKSLQFFLNNNTKHVIYAAAECLHTTGIRRLQASHVETQEQSAC